VLFDDIFVFNFFVSRPCLYSLGLDIWKFWCIQLKKNFNPIEKHRSIILIKLGILFMPCLTKNKDKSWKQASISCYNSLKINLLLKVKIKQIKSIFVSGLIRVNSDFIVSKKVDM